MPRENHYLDDLAWKIFRAAHPEATDLSDSDLRLYRIYAVLGLAKGDQTTSEDVHNAWVAWCSDVNYDHHSMVPFNQLTSIVQDLDNLYRDAIHRVTGTWRFSPLRETYEDMELRKVTFRQGTIERPEGEPGPDDDMTPFSSYREIDQFLAESGYVPANRVRAIFAFFDANGGGPVK